MKNSEKYLLDILKEAEATDGNDAGHQALLKDVAMLTREVIDFQFHDFKNQRYAMPKVELVSRLQALTKNTMDGKYDN